MAENGLLSVDNGVDKIVDADAELIAREYYTDYAKYVLEYRALPSVYDGLKPVQRRAIYTASQQPRKLMKTAKLSGLTMQYHPHSSDSIDGAINNMAYQLNNMKIFDTKGNFGSPGASAAASRYTEVCLGEVGRLNFCQFLDYADYEVGEIGELEPVALPSLVPYCLVQQTEGIAIGLSTKVIPLNILDLIDYYIDYIKNDGKTKKKIKPDFGHVLLETPDIFNEIKKCQCRVTTSSIVTQISSTTFVIEGIYGKSVDAFLNKVDKYYNYLSSGKVGYRDATTTTPKYVFEIYDSSVDPVKFKDHLIWASRGNSSFTRVVEEDGKAVYSSLSHVIEKSLEYLNKVINKKISTELDRSKYQLSIYEVLELCKTKDVFKDIASITVDELVNNIVLTSGCEVEVAKEIVKKPISYLTRSHNSEINSLKTQIEDLENHDRKKYLISLYKELRKAVLPRYEELKHSVSGDEVISDPRIKDMGDGTYQVTDGDGEEFDSTIYFVSDKGYVYRRSVSSLVKTDVFVDTENDDKIIGFVTDKYKYLFLLTEFPYSNWEGRLIFSMDDLSRDRKIINLREGKDEEKIVKVEGLNTITSEDESAVKSRVSRSVYFKR